MERDQRESNEEAQKESNQEYEQESDEEDEPEFLEDAVKNRLPLRAKIEKLIKPHRHSTDQKPPFSVKELIVMAVICSDTIAPREPVIFGWIIYTFQYYSTLAVQQYVQYMEDGLFGGRGVLDIVVEGFYKFFNSRGNPLIPRWREGEETVYSITPEKARSILCPHLEPRSRSSSSLSRSSVPS